MLRPVGNLPATVYWRRRVVLLAVFVAVIFLLVITLHTLGSGGGAVTAASTTSRSSSTTPSTTSPPPSSVSTTSSATTPSPTASGSTVLGACTPAQLKIVAATDKPTYNVGDQPVVAMQVTNTGPTPCTEALGDAQIEFRVYNGAARVWGSHDCKIDPTPDVETLAVNSTVAKTVAWSGYSSETNCGTRQKVGAGTYTLYAYLNGTQGTTAQFSINS
jgi:cytoskeletal protein RodZ